MSAVREGGHLVSQAKDLTATFENGVVTAPGDTSTAAQGGASAVQFPRKFGGRDAYDDVMQMRQQLVTDPATGQTPFGRLQYTDDVARWMMRKEQAGESANFDSWFAKNYHKNSLAERQFAQEVNPEFYSAREREIMTKAQEAAKLKIIQLRGPRTKEELMKVWLIESGRVVLPPNWDQIGSTYSVDDAAGKAEALKNFNKGLFRLPSFTGRNYREGPADAAQNPFKVGKQAAQNPFPMFGNGESAPLSTGVGTVGQKFLSQVRNQ